MSRKQKVAGLLKVEISNIIQTRLKDPRIGFVTITNVTLTSDLRMANVYFSVLGDEAQVASTLRGLERARAYIQSQLAARIRLRYLPVLRFFHDSTLEYSAHIDEILKTLKMQDHETENGQ